jgi:hypothetical protein
MRLLLSTFLLLGLAVSVLSVLVWLDEANRWSSLIAQASATGALQNQAFADRIGRAGLLQSPFAGATLGAGLVICALAIWRLIVETRP